MRVVVLMKVQQRLEHATLQHLQQNSDGLLDARTSFGLLTKLTFLYASFTRLEGANINPCFWEKPI